MVKESMLNNQFLAVDSFQNHARGEEENPP